MAARTFEFTSESVTEGHPDKIADQISDAVLDAVLRDDENGRVACETLITTGLVVVAGEITTETYVDVRSIVRETIAKIGYTRAKYGFDAETCGVMVAIDDQSSDIAQGVDASYEAQHGDADPIDRMGAGDQGMMFGYASDETDELMPLPIMLAHKLTRRLAEVRKADVLPYLRPDGKSQVTVRYEVDEHGRQRPVAIERVLISTQHRDGLDAESLIKPDLLEHVVEPVLHAEYRDLVDTAKLGAKDFLYVNPTGKFVIGGPMGDTGPHRAQDHRRHLRRRRAARRRRLLRQGPDQGRPVGRVRRPPRREERRRGGPRAALPGAGRLRDRRRPPDERPRRLLRHRARRDSPTSGSPSSSGRRSTSARARSSATSSSVGRSTRRRPRTATSAAPTPTSPGSAPTGSTQLREAAGLGAAAAV